MSLFLCCVIFHLAIFYGFVDSKVIVESLDVISISINAITSNWLRKFESLENPLTSYFCLTVSEAAETACNLSGKMFAAGALSTLYVIGGDFYPTLLRSQSYGASSVLSRILSMLAPFLLFLGDIAKSE